MKKNEFVLQDFDEFLDQITKDTAKLSAVLSLNQELNEELDQLHKELQRKDAMILGKDEGGIFFYLFFQSKFGTD